MKNKRNQIYELVEFVQGDTQEDISIIFKELIAFLPTHKLSEFVEHFKQNHNIMGYEQYELCMDCQDTFDSNKSCGCEDTQPSQGTSSFFSSLVPEC